MPALSTVLGHDAFNSASMSNVEPADAGYTESIKRGLLFGAAVLVLLLPPVIHQHWSIPAAPSPGSRFTDFGTVQAVRASGDVRHVADWVADSGDNAGHYFVIVDKQQASVHVFDSQARLRGSTPVLLGAARGDHSAAGIGLRPIADVRPEERTTPAGRFVAERGRNTLGEDVIWIDYDAAVSMHRVRAIEPKERRLERLATPSADDNRISYGCINVPVDFYETHIGPTFAGRRAVVYVLPEDRSVQQVFGSYDVAAAHRAVVY